MVQWLTKSSSLLQLRRDSVYERRWLVKKLLLETGVRVTKSIPFYNSRIHRTVSHSNTRCADHTLIWKYTLL